MMKNNSKSKNWMKYSAAVITFLAVFSFFASISHRLVIFRSGFLADVLPRVLIDLTNQNRLSFNLNKLNRSQVLIDAAQRKANDMASKSYFAHTSPEGLSPWYWFEKADYNFLYAGENLAVHFSDSGDVVKAWMESPSHRDNILNIHFTEIGIATAKGYFENKETVFVVQMFGRPSALAPAPSAEKKAVANETTSVDQSPEIAAESGNEAVNRVVEIASAENENEKFLAVQNPEALLLEAQEKPEIEKTAIAGESANYSSAIERLFASPSLLLKVFYFALAAVIIFLLSLGVLIEFNRHHYYHIAYGVGLLIIMLVLYFVYRNSFGEVEVLSVFL